MANSSPILNLHNRRVECRTNAIPASSSLAWMRTCEPTPIGPSASTNTPDALMLSTRPRIILPLWSLSSPCDRFTGQQMGKRSETLASPLPMGFVAAASSSCRLVQERLIEIKNQNARWCLWRQFDCRWKPVSVQSGKVLNLPAYGDLFDSNSVDHRPRCFRRVLWRNPVRVRGRRGSDIINQDRPWP